MVLALDNDPAEAKGLSKDQKIIEEAKKNYKRCIDWESETHKLWREDVRFANGDARNHHQWPDTVWQERDGDDRPCLTINKIRTHNRIIINEAMQNKSSVKIRPTGGEASYLSAQMMQALIRRTEYVSKADIAYRTAIKHQVEGGFGYVTLHCDYISDKSFDQDVKIRRVRDPLMIWLDPDAQDPTGLDANFGFEFEIKARSSFFRKWKKWKNKLGATTLGADQTTIDDDHILQVMYYRRSGEMDELIGYTEPSSGQEVVVFRSEQESELIDPIIEQIRNGDLEGNIRDVMNQSVDWFLIAGDEIIDRGDSEKTRWPGKYIPIVRLVGDEEVMDGRIDRKGMTRYLIDQQRMLNYNASGQVEFGALQNKAPYVGPARAFEGQEWWKDANRKNYAFLPFNDVDDEAPEGLQEIGAPKRQDPPQTSPVYAEGMLNAEKQMMMASGQYQAQMGENENAKSGRAISERQRQGDTATYHFIEHQGDMYRNLGTQLLDLYPKIYDTERRLSDVLGDRGEKLLIQINPNSQEIIKELQNDDKEIKEYLFNPTAGEYDCISDVGPNYATRRQEAWNAMSIMLQQNQELTSVVGDLFFKNGDFDQSDELAERMRKEIQSTKPYLFSDDDPALMGLQQKMQQLTGLNSELMQKLAEMQLKLRGREEKRDIDAFNAETTRSKAKSDGELGMLKLQLEAVTKLLLAPPDQRIQFEQDLRIKAMEMDHEHATMGRQHVFNLIEAANEADLAPKPNGSGQ